MIWILASEGPSVTKGLNVYTFTYLLILFTLIGLNTYLAMAGAEEIPPSARPRFGDWIMVTWDKGEPGFSRRYPSFDACEAARSTVIESLLQGGTDKAAQRLSEFRSTFPNEALAQSFIRDALRRAKADQMTERQERAVRLVRAASPDPSAAALRDHQVNLLTRHTICDYHPTRAPGTQPN